jgi:hypothetical protein
MAHGFSLGWMMDGMILAGTADHSAQEEQLTIGQQVVNAAHSVMDHLGQESGRLHYS